MSTRISPKPFGEWLEHKIDEWDLRGEVEAKVDRLMFHAKNATGGKAGRSWN